MWDIPWLLTQGAQLDLSLLGYKVADYGVHDYRARLDRAIFEVPALAASSAFIRQVRRFLGSGHHKMFFATQGYASYFSNALTGLLGGIQLTSAAVLGAEDAANLKQHPGDELG